jgi:hypothetical protein
VEARASDGRKPLAGSTTLAPVRSSATVNCHGQRRLRLLAGLHPDPVQPGGPISFFSQSSTWHVAGRLVVARDVRVHA